ncbi:DUF29 domain-containing protein [Azospirillum sp. SYSU D00513]|uniref:DUF29 domain-containing protein n=1 Tax=Azospirillum sp. SYSU D00513 TaxID=2812561 RepID=UPI001A9744D3|nr:DUF29 domain-containing protein [Azospirillum sp. SYSU D00513]
MGAQPAYDDDFYAWTQEQARLLRAASSERINTPIDWEHVAEELESMGRSDLRAVNSHFACIIEHLLKLEFSPTTEPRGGWRRTVREQRASALDALSDSPSLRGKIDLVLIFRRGRGFAMDGLGQDRVDEADLPALCPCSLKDILNEDWWPASRHGLA